MNPYLPIAAVLVVPVVLAVRWSVQRIKQSGRDETRIEMRDEFIMDVATNHLPHIESALQAIAQHVGIHIPEPPPIHFFVKDK
jgi:hypothetical protein